MIGAIFYLFFHKNSIKIEIFAGTNEMSSAAEEVFSSGKYCFCIEETFAYRTKYNNTTRDYTVAFESFEKAMLVHLGVSFRLVNEVYIEGELIYVDVGQYRTTILPHEIKLLCFEKSKMTSKRFPGCFASETVTMPHRVVKINTMKALRGTNILISSYE